MKNIVTNIQRFCLQDGPGIRTTIFFKGCNLNCPWCSNPENQSFEIEKSIDGEKTYGKEYDIENLYNEIIKDKLYFDNYGGVTFSGGEPLFHAYEIEPLLKMLKKEHISIAFETACAVPINYLEQIINYIDYFLIDIKILTENAKEKINEDVCLFEKNIELIMENNKKVFFRIPLVKNYTYTKENIVLINKFLNKYNIKNVDVFNVHNLGIDKYKSLGKKYDSFTLLNDKDFDYIKKELKGINVNILKV